MCDDAENGTNFQFFLCVFAIFMTTVYYFSNNVRRISIIQLNSISGGVQKTSSFIKVTQFHLQRKKSEQTVPKFSSDPITFSFSLAGGFVEIEIVTFTGIMSHLSAYDIAWSDQIE